MRRCSQLENYFLTVIVTIDAEPVEEPDHLAQGNAEGVGLAQLDQRQLRSL